MGENKFYFKNLDGLRFFCFLSVFFFHSFHTENQEIRDSEIFIFFKETLFGNGFLGVNFFFVLSGFLITFLLVKEKQLVNKINIGKFWIRRILRIWPLYFVCVFYGFFIFPFTKTIAGSMPNESANIWYYLSFISNFDYIKKGLPDSPGLGVLWSVAIEEQFYFFWPIILSLFSIKKFWIPLTSILIISLIYRSLNDVPILHEMHTISCIGDMAIGGLGAWLIIKSKSFYNLITNMPMWQIVLIYCLFFLFYFSRDELLLSTFVTRVLERMIISSVMLLIILEQCYSKNSFYKMSNFSIPSRLGLVTYGLYCIHFIVISVIVGILKLLGYNKSLWQVLFLETSISLVLTIIISLISYKYFEAPFLKLKEKFTINK